MKDTIKKEDIINGLGEMGLNNGDKVLVHSSLSKFGYVENGANAVINACLESAGENGTVIVPTLTGSSKLNKDNPPVFDPINTPCWTGKISETFRLRKNALRSLHPTHSVSAIGRKAGYFTEGHENSLMPCDENSPYWKLKEKGGYILFLGVTLNSCTFFHTLEEIAKVPYHMQEEKVKAKLIINGKEIIKELYLHKYGTKRNFTKVEPMLLENKVMKTRKIGNADVKLVSAKGLADIILPLIMSDKWYLTK